MQFDPWSTRVSIDVRSSVRVSVIHRQPECLHALEQHVLPHSAAWMNMMAVAANKTRTFIPVCAEAGGMQRWLYREHERGYARAGAQGFAVEGYGIFIDGEDIIKKRGDRKSVVQGKSRAP